MKKEVTVREVALKWIEEKRHHVKKSTYGVYLQILNNHIIPALGDHVDPDEETLRRFAMGKVEGGLNVKTVKDILVVYGMLWRYGVKNGCFASAYWSIKLPPAPEPPRLAMFSVVHQRMIARYVMSNFTFRNLGIYICLGTGMRIGEVCGLKWGDIDMLNKVICVKRTIARIYEPADGTGTSRYRLMEGVPKTPSSLREIPLSSELYRMLRPLVKLMNPEHYILTNEPSPTEPKTYRNYYNRLLDTLGIPHVKFHGLRHSFATRCIESRCDCKTISSVLGHADVRTTLNLYVHPDVEQKRRCVDKMWRTIR